MKAALKAPFPYFGGKAKAAALVWARLGDVRNYIEPFAGSAAMLLARPHAPAIETLNDANCYIANFWRSVEQEPERVARACNYPVSEADLHAWHRYLVLSEQSAAFREAIRIDPHYCDPVIAGRWVWGMCQWIGAGWCNLNEDQGYIEGRTADGDCEERRPQLSNSNGILKQQMPAIAGDSGASGRGIHRKLPRLSGYNPDGIAVHGKRVKLSGHGVGAGVHLSGYNKRPARGDGNGGPGSKGVILFGGRPQLADAFSRGRGVHGHDSVETCAAREEWLIAWFRRLQDRLRPVRICCGDWLRVCGSPSVTTRIGLTGVFLDPPYAGEIDGEKSRDHKIYSTEDLLVGAKVRAWCIEHGNDPMFRIALCGLEGEHNELEELGWEKVSWRNGGGYGNRSEANRNRERERIWFSPHCLKLTESVRTLF